MGFPIFAAIGAGLSIYEGISGARQGRELAKSQIASVDRQVSLINKQRKELEAAFGKKRGFIVDEFGNQVDTLLSRVGANLSSIKQSEESGIAKSDLAFSGTVEGRSDLAKRQQRKGFEIAQEGLSIKLGSELTDLATEKAATLGGLDVQLAGLAGERAVLEKQAEPGLLEKGKNFVGGLLFR